MNRIIPCLALALGSLLGDLHVARADERAPTAEELQLAKQAFEEGNTLYKAGKLLPAADKLKESYKLSRNPFLLYNIGLIYDQLGQQELALHFFRRFLATAPANAPMRPDVTSRVAKLDAAQVPEANPDEPTAQTPTSVDKQGIELQHQLVETSLPHTAVDITATAPKDGDLTITLSYRGSDDTTFTTVPMTRRELDLVAQIPAERMRGNYVQYYLEARNRTGTIVARVGKSTSPNLIKIEGGATSSVGLEFDPLSEKRRFGETLPEPPTQYAKATLISTTVTAAMIGTTVMMYVLAKKQSDALRDDSTSCGLPPCTPFDEDYDHRLQVLGERYNTAYRVTLVLSVASAGVAGYFWFRRVSAARATPTDRVSLVPVISDDFTGAATVGRF